MPCACKGGQAGAGTEYVVTFKDGTTQTFDSPMTARIEAGKLGGKVQARQKPRKA